MAFKMKGFTYNKPAYKMVNNENEADDGFYMTIDGHGMTKEQYNRYKFLEKKAGYDKADLFLKTMPKNPDSQVNQ